MSPSTNVPSEGKSGLAAVDTWTSAQESTALPVGPIDLEAEGSRTELITPSARLPQGRRIRYTVTETQFERRQGESVFLGRHMTSSDDIAPYDVPPKKKDDRISALASKCTDLIDRMLETQDIIERENIYRTLDVSLAQLFDLRTSCERGFGHLLVLLLGITKHTTSEFFTGAQLSALKQALNLIKKPRIVDTDLQDARRVLHRAGFDLFRPMRGVFEDV